MPSDPIVYRIDAADRLTFVGAGWDDFALANNGAGATGESVLGRPLWDFISDVTTAEIYRQVLARIRTGRAMRFEFRCDSPECRRLLEMKIQLVDDTGAVEFRSTTLEEHEREQPSVQSAQADGAGPEDEPGLIRVCGWCNRLDAAGEWVEVEEALPRLRLLEYPDGRMLTHGICEDCLVKMTAELVAMDGDSSPRAERRN